MLREVFVINMDKIKKKYISYLGSTIITACILNGCAGLDFPLLNDMNSKTSKENSQESADSTLEIIPDTIVINNGGKDYGLALDSNDEESIDTAENEPEYEEIYDDINKIYSKKCANSDKIIIEFAGDTCFYDDFSLMSKFRERGSDIDNCIDAFLLQEMRDSDIFMINNEFCYSDRGSPREGKKYAFRSKPSNVDILLDMGADIVSLANNHAYDWGPDALMDTFDVLEGARIPYVGAGRNIDEAMKPVYYKANGITVSFVSATQIERTANPDTKEATADSPGVLRTLEPTKACKVIEEARANSDFVIMYVHWGSENTDLVEQSQRDLAKKYVESGADLIIGDHSHCLQGVDYIDDVPVFFSLGNYWFNSKTMDTGLAKVILTNDAEIESIQFIPAKQINCSTKEVSPEEGRRILEYMQGISNYAEIDTDTGYIYKSEVNHNTQGGVNTSPTKKVEPPPEEQTVDIIEMIDGL